MIEERPELTSLEVRSLMLEALAYEGSELDPDGHNFKKYGYQGTQGNLFRLMDRLAVKKELIKEVIKVSRTAWGDPGALLHEFSSINFNRYEILKIYEEFNDLLIQGILAPGAYGNYGANLPYFHVTEHGLICLNQRDILPYDKDGYLKKIKDISNVNEWVVFYITEALKCFNANCLNSAVINIGLAGEVIAEELIKGFKHYLSKKEPRMLTTFENALRSATAISIKYDRYLNNRKSYLRNHPSDTALMSFSKTLDTPSTSIYATYTRLTRNSLSHHSEVIMDRIQVLMFFVSLVKYCQLQYDLINYYNAA